MRRVFLVLLQVALARGSCGESSSLFCYETAADFLCLVAAPSREKCFNYAFIAEDNKDVVFESADVWPWVEACAASVTGCQQLAGGTFRYKTPPSRQVSFHKKTGKYRLKLAGASVAGPIQWACDTEQEAFDLLNFTDAVAAEDLFAIAPPDVLCTDVPTTSPTSAPTTTSPTSAPTSAPTTTSPTSAPTTNSPTSTSPTSTSPTSAPTTTPTSAPSLLPTAVRDNEGSDFVLALMPNFQRGGDQETSLMFITSKNRARGFVTSVSRSGASFRFDFLLDPNDLGIPVYGNNPVIKIPALVSTGTADGIEDAGFRVTANPDVVVYVVNRYNDQPQKSSMEAYLALPTAVLGTHYVALAYVANIPGQSSQLTVVAVEDETIVEITPAFDAGTRIKGEAYSITLNALQTYLLQSDEDVTGTTVSATKAVAVFAGGTCLNVPTGFFACDHLVQQLPPTSAWGRDFVTVGLAERTAGDVFRILARDDQTDIIIDGSLVATLDATDFYETSLGGVHAFQTSSPVLVAQYCKGEDADPVLTDPFMMLVPPIKHFLASYTLTTPVDLDTSFSYRHFINVAVQASDYDQCTLDGDSMALSTRLLTPSAGVNIPDSPYLAAQFSVSEGTHDLRCPNPFGAYVYGYGNFRSYGYPAGMALTRISSLTS